MRFTVPLVFMLCSFPAVISHAAAQPAGLEDSGDNETSSLHQNSAQAGWLDADAGRRRAILAAWRELPDTTRPPFPVFRDQALQASPDNPDDRQLTAENHGKRKK